MSVVPLALEITLVAVLSMLLLHRYGNYKKQHIIVTLSTFVAWYFSFMIIFIIPLDISSAFHRQCTRENDLALTTPSPSPGNLTTTAGVTNVTNATTGAPPGDAESLKACTRPWSLVPEHVLANLWKVVYWTSQLLTWLVLPLMQSYTSAAEFTVSGKIKRALIENAIFYGTYLAIFGVCLIYIAVKPGIELDASKLKVIGITASNTWGLFLLVLLLGYGLVEVPRLCWHSSDQAQRLHKTYFKIAKLSSEKVEAEENVEDSVHDAKRLAERMPPTHPLRKHVDTIIRKVPEQMQWTVENTRVVGEGGGDLGSEGNLVRLHKKMIAHARTYHRTQVQWNSLLQQAAELEDVAQNMRSLEKTYKRSTGKYTGFFRLVYSPAIEWWWVCVARQHVLRCVSAALALLSLLVVWSELTFFSTNPTISLFAVFVNLAQSNYNFALIEVCCIISITYIAVCAYYTVFKVRVLNYYYLSPHHMTDEYSLLFSGMLLCRLTPPLCLNFLGLVHLDSHVTNVKDLEETSYTQIMGHMDVISFIADGFNIYFPILIVLLCVATFFRLGTRLLHCLGFQQFLGEDEFTLELVDEGRELVRRDRRRRERQEEGEARRQRWRQKFGEGSASRESRLGAAEGSLARQRDGVDDTTGKEEGRKEDGKRKREEKYPILKNKALLTTSPEDDGAGLVSNAAPLDYSDELPPLHTFTPAASSYHAGGQVPRNIFDDV